MFLMNRRTRIPVTESVAGTYPTMEEVEQLVDRMMLNSDSDVCLNIVRSEEGYTVQSVKWQ